MGCGFCKEKKEPAEVPKSKEYSWDKRLKADPKDYTISDVSNVDICRGPGSIIGQHFVIENCKNCSIYILDHLDSVNIDNCTDCRIVLGPVKGSVFLRECSDSVLVIPCSQFRARDSHHIDIFLYCATQPIIESSTHMRFACIRLFYRDFKAHLAAAGLCMFNNMWRNVHDFTPVEGDLNWRVLPDKVRLQDCITPPFPSPVLSWGWSVTGEPGVIPITQGITETKGRDLCLVLVLADKQLHINSQRQLQEECALAFLTTLFQDQMTSDRTVSVLGKGEGVLYLVPKSRIFEANDEWQPCEALIVCFRDRQNHHSQLLTTRQVQLRSEDAVALMPDSKPFAPLLDLGPAIGLVLAGEGSTVACKKVAELPTLSGRTYVSSSAETVTSQVQSFIRSATVLLGC